MNRIDQLTAILERAQELASAVMLGDEVEQELAEEVSGELSEFIEHLQGCSNGMDQEAIDPDLYALALTIRAL